MSAALRRIVMATSRSLQSPFTRTTATRVRSTSRAFPRSISLASKCCADRRVPCSAATQRAAQSSSSRRPTEEFEGYATATFGRFNQSDFRGSGFRPDLRQVAGPSCLHQQSGRRLYRGRQRHPDRGANDHYALRGQLAWQPTDETDVNLILRYLRADHERKRASIRMNRLVRMRSDKASSRRRLSTALSGQGPGEAGTGFRNDAIIPSRGGDPWKTAETEPSSVDREIFGAQCAWITTSAARRSPRSPITRLPTSSISRGAMPRRSTACSSSRAATSTRFHRSCAFQVDRRPPVRRRPVRHGGGRRLHRPVRRPALRLRSDVAFSQQTTSSPRSSRTNGASAIAGS